MNKTVVLLLTYRDSKVVQQLFEKLKRDLGNTYDFKILFNRKTSIPLKHVNKDDCYFFADNIINTMGFKPFTGNKENQFYGNDHFPLFKFASEHDYENYWVIEDDVRFSGTWSTFFDALEPYETDYVASNFHRNPLGHFQSFNAIYKLSSRAISFLSAYFTNTQSAIHHEHSFAHLLNRHGYNLLDFGGISGFAPIALREGFYNNLYDKDLAQVTLRFKDGWTEWGDLPDKIYHPVKVF